ncbi:ADP-ribosylation [Neolentinus lepideus HHB14362 ss-1]|uniref:Poly [ADP-ribose] polymerase n=1 Tax=Neolentinus lepideus HHB14362 ss-1 TaxID=1314782 RepID=A0A165UGY0_9AGAM|nr:ADP-ribosylation [Neolentinus lepideus HHB14362 ss-1]
MGRVLHHLLDRFKQKISMRDLQRPDEEKSVLDQRSPWNLVSHPVVYPDCPDLAVTGSPDCSWDHKQSSNAMSTMGGYLLELSGNDPKYSGVLEQFRVSWRDPTKSFPPVYRIYKIYMPEDIHLRYEKYKADIAQKRELPGGNECRRFHGTNRACCLGENGQTTLCDSENCSLCGILKYGFKLDLAGRNKPWGKHHGGRFGRGIYTSSTSSKSHDYCYNLPNGRAGPKAMLLTRVVVGRGKKLFKNDHTLTCPPDDYDAVIGEKRSESEGDLNYDELVVYNDHAVIPGYLIIYGSEGDRSTPLGRQDATGLKI